MATIAIGNQIGQFSLKSTSLTYQAEGTGQANFEGSVEGTGLTGEVLHFAGEPGAKSGTCRWAGCVYLENGEEITGTSQGTFESSGKHCWRIGVILSLSDGRTQLTDGELDLATRLYTGNQ